MSVLQFLPGLSDRDAEAMRCMYRFRIRCMYFDLRGYALEHFADPDAVLVVDETGDRTPVLVHNCGDGLKYVAYTKINVLTGEVYAERTMGYGDDAAVACSAPATWGIT